MDDCGRIMLSAQKQRVDRFVVPRESLPEISRRVKWRSRHSQEDEAEIWSNKYYNQKKYSDFLDKAFNLTPLKIYREPVDPRPHSDWCWPCEPRRKRFLSTADNILDLPAYSSAAFPDLLDWSKEDILVAALGRYYYKWSWKLQRAVSQGFTMYDIQCCKFDPTGKYLLLATHFRVEVHNEACKCRLVQYCKCNLRLCTVTTVDWSPTGRSYVMGCSRGMICAGDRRERIISSVSLFDNATLTAKISPNARFVAVTAVRHSTVWVLAWPQLDRFRYLNTNYIIKDLCWHPWETALLGVATIGRDYQARVVLWEPNGVRYREERVGRGQFSIDVMKFNHRTGELLLSLWSLGVPYNKSSELVVMSDFGTVVDHWGEGQTGLNRVRTMVFSADGTKLATATADEDLIICNFLPNDFKRNKIPRKFMAMPQLLDLFSCGFTIR